MATKEICPTAEGAPMTLTGSLSAMTLKNEAMTPFSPVGSKEIACNEIKYLEVTFDGREMGIARMHWIDAFTTAQSSLKVEYGPT